MAKAYYLLISATAGAAVLALEVLAARTMAPVLGSGSVTWSALLAVALGMLAIGNLAGGLLADRVRPGGVIAWSLGVGAACLVLLSQYYSPAMRWSAGLSLLTGAVTAAAITQAVPIAMLGTITPVILRLGREESPKGWWAGLVLAAGSGGGIAGALTAGLVLLPELGLARSYLLVSGLLAVATVPAVCQQRRWLAALLVLASLALAGVCWHRYEPGRVIQSRHGQLEVETSETGHVLLIDGLPQTGLPTELLDAGFLPGDGLRYGYLLEVALFMRPWPRNALVIGLGAGLAPRLLAAHGIDCETIEIDPAVVEIAKQEFHFKGRTTVADGRRFLSDTSRQWDLIFLDVCTSDRLPWHLFTLEAMQILRDRLSPEGILVIQFIGDDGPWSASLARTADAVFGKSLMLAAAYRFGGVGPRWLYATRGYPPRLPDGLFPPETPPPWDAIRPADEGLPLTDDHFPAELHWARTARRWRSLYAVAPVAGGFATEGR